VLPAESEFRRHSTVSRPPFHSVLRTTFVTWSHLLQHKRNVPNNVQCKHPLPDLVFICEISLEIYQESGRRLSADQPSCTSSLHHQWPTKLWLRGARFSHAFWWWIRRSWNVTPCRFVNNYRRFLSNPLPCTASPPIHYCTCLMYL